MTTTDSPRIYVACLAAYNNGVLHGCWIDADQDAEDIHAEIQEMLKASPVAGAEEWAIHDYEGFGSGKVGEYADIAQVAEMAQLIAKHGDPFRAYLSITGPEDVSESDFEDRYEGEHDNAKSYADDRIENDLDTLKGMIKSAVYGERERKSIIGLLESLASHIDADSLRIDLEAEGYSFERLALGGPVYVFRPY